jgi:hypothetical protein
LLLAGVTALPETLARAAADARIRELLLVNLFAVSANTIPRVA